MQQALIVNVGGIGPALDVSSFASDKIIEVVGLGAGDSLVIEVSTDGVNFNEAKTFTQSNSTQHLKYPALEIRANALAVATGGVTASVEADLSATQAKIIPTPALDAIGAAIDISSLGNLSTLSLNNLVPASASINLEVSNDGVNYHQLLTFTEDDSVVKNVNQKFIRAVSVGASAADLSMVSEEKASETAVGASICGITWRIDATGDDDVGGNVYARWVDVYAAIKRVRNAGGRIELWFDASQSLDTSVPAGFGGMMIPGGTATNGADVNANDGKYVWDMSNTEWVNVWDQFGDNPYHVNPTVYFEDTVIGSANAYIDSLARVAFKFGDIWHDGTVHTPFRGIMGLSGHVRMFNTIVNAQPMFEPRAGHAFFEQYQWVLLERSELGSQGAFTFDTGLTSPAPLVHGRDSLMIPVLEGGLMANNTFDGGAFCFFLMNSEGGHGQHKWEMPGLDLNAAFGWGIGQLSSVQSNIMPFSYGDAGPGEPGPVWVTADNGTILWYNTSYEVDASGGDFAMELPTSTRVFGNQIKVTNAGATGVFTATPKAASGETVQSPTVLPGESKTWECGAGGTWFLVSQANSLAKVAYTIVSTESEVLIDDAGVPTIVNNNQVLASLIATLKARAIID